MFSKPFLTLCYLVVLPYAVLGGFMNMNAKSGPYDIEVHKLEACEDSGSGETMFPTKITKVDRNKYVYSETIRIQPAMDEFSKVYIELQELGNGGYRPRAMEHTAKGCKEFFKLTGDNIKKIFKSAGVTVDGCPIPAGNFSLKNYALDVTGPVPVMTYNKYRIIFNIYYKDKKVGCLMGYGETVAKPMG